MRGGTPPKQLFWVAVPGWALAYRLGRGRIGVAKLLIFLSLKQTHPAQHPSAPCHEHRIASQSHYEKSRFWTQ